MLKKIFIATFLFAVFFQINTFNVANAGNTLTIINNTGQTIVHIYCSTSTDPDKWGRERLGNDVLEPGNSFTIRTAPVTTHRYVHVAVGVYIRGELEFRSIKNIDLNKISSINIDGNFK